MSEKQEEVFLGRAVRDGKLVFTSVSQIKLFDPANEGCHRKWAYRYLFKKKLAFTTALVKGADFADKFEHYLTTGEDVLPPELQPAKKYFPTPGRDLQCEKPLGDMERAIALRELWLRETDVNKRMALHGEMELAAGLLANSVPIDGAADVRHRRGNYIDHDGNLRDEAKNSYVINIGDLKTVTRIYPHTIKKGKSAGTVLQSFCLTDAEVCEDTQMVGYGRHAVNLYPGITHARLQHYYANKEKREAVLRMGIISIEQILERWTRTEDVVAEMEQVAGATKIEDIEPNPRACDSYTHVDPADPAGKRVLKGCGHRYYCPLAISESVPHLMGDYKESAMSLFDQVPAPPSPPTAAHPGTVGVEGYKPGQLCNGRGYYASSNGQGFAAVEVGHSCAGCTNVAPPPPPAPPAPPQSPIAVNPPDQPKAPGMLEMAAPVPPGEIAQIEDPALKARVEEHARQHAANAAAEAARQEEAKIAAGAAVWCPISTTKIVITSEIAVARKWICQCSKSYSLSVLKPVKEGDQMVSVIPRHKFPKKEGETTTAPAAPTPEPHITIRDESGKDVIAPTAPTEVAPPPPPAPPIVESGRTSYADANLANPPRADIPTPPAPPDMPIVDMSAAPPAPPAPPVSTNGHANGNGHSNGNGIEQRMEQLQNFGVATLAAVAESCAFKVELHAAEADDVIDCVVIAPSMKEAMAKVEAMGDIVSIALISDMVIA